MTHQPLTREEIEAACATWGTWLGNWEDDPRDIDAMSRALLAAQEHDPVYRAARELVAKYPYRAWSPVRPLREALEAKS